MADTPNISMAGGIRPISGGSGNSPHHHQEQAPKKEKKPSKLRVGEILRGTIAERIDSKLAHVRIPTGTFKAVVANNLKKDDTLLFKVAEIEPHLVLKVHEVGTGSKEKPANPRNIIRMLDLAEDEFHVELIKKMIEKRTAIVRDDVLEVFKLYSEIKDDLKRTPLEQIIELVLEMNASDLPMSKNLAIKLVPLFVDENKISESLNSIYKYRDVIDKTIRPGIEGYYEYIIDNHLNKNNIFSINKTDGHEKSFYDLMIKITELEVSNTDIPRLQRNASRVRDFIAALGLWNIISFMGNASVQQMIPYYYEDQFYVIRIVQRKVHHANNEPISFTFSVPSENLGNVNSKIMAFQKQLKVYMQARNEKIVSSINKNQRELKYALAQNEFSLSSFNIGIEDIKDEINEISKSSSGGQHFTIVV